MKKLLTGVFTLLLAVSLAYAQNTGGDKKPKGQDNPQESNKQGTLAGPISKPPDTTSGKKGHKSGKKGHHKGGKKSKKGSSGTNTPPPK